MSELSLPERIVHAAETAIEELADVIRTSPTGAVEVEGMLVDFAKYSAAAVIEMLTEHLSSTGWKPRDVRELFVLAQAVRDVPAVKAV